MNNKIAFGIHKWLGGTIGLYLAVMSLSGTAIVFGDEITQFANQSEQIRQLNAYRASTINIPADAPEAKQKSIGALIKEIERQKPGLKVTAISSMGQDRQPLNVTMSGKDGGANIYADSKDGHVLGENQKVPVIEFLTDLHQNLRIGKTGRTTNGFGGLLLLTMITTGVILWWRGKFNSPQWRKGFVMLRHKSGIPRARSMHAVVGIWLLPMLLTIGVTGTYLGFADQFKGLLGLNGAGAAIKEGDQSQRLPIDEIVALATASATSHALPDTKPHLTRLILSKRQSTVMRASFADQNDLPSDVWIDSQTGAIVTSDGPVNCDNNTGLTIWFARIHFAKVAGVWSKILWVSLAWLLALLYISGVYMWRQRVSAIKNKSLSSTSNNPVPATDDDSITGDQ